MPSACSCNVFNATDAASSKGYLQRQETGEASKSLKNRALRSGTNRKGATKASWGGLVAIAVYPLYIPPFSVPRWLPQPAAMPAHGGGGAGLTRRSRRRWQGRQHNGCCSLSPPPCFSCRVDRGGAARLSLGRSARNRTSPELPLYQVRAQSTMLQQRTASAKLPRRHKRAQDLVQAEQSRQAGHAGKASQPGAPHW